MDPGPEGLFTLQGRITTAALALAGAFQVYRWVGRRKLTVAYGLLWLASCFALLATAAFPTLLVGLGRLAGSRQPEGAMRLAGFVFVAVVLLYLSLRVSDLEARLEALVQALALDPQTPAATERALPAKGPDDALPRPPAHSP